MDIELPQLNFNDINKDPKGGPVQCVQNPERPDPTQTDREVIGVTEAEVAGFMETSAQNAGLSSKTPGNVGTSN